MPATMDRPPVVDVREQVPVAASKQARKVAFMRLYLTLPPHERHVAYDVLVKSARSEHTTR